MEVLIILIGSFIGLYWIVPKGNLLHELLYFPIFWVRQLLQKRVPVKEEQISYGPHKNQYFLQLTPQNGIQKKEIIVYFHGGGWRFGRPNLFRLNGSFFADRGYLVLMPAHRKPPRNNFVQIREDLNLLLRKVTELATDLELFDFKIIACGMSSGGHLATILVFDQNTLEQLSFPKSRFAGLFINAAPLDFNLMQDRSILRDLAGPRSGELFQIANPANYLSPEINTPILHFHGTKDGMVPYDSVRPFIRDIQQYHRDYRFFAIEKGNHYQALNWLFSAKKERALLETWLARISREI